MKSPNVSWWQWLIGAAVCAAIAIVTGPVADRHGYGTLPGLVISILAWVGCSVSFLVGFMRFLKTAKSAKT